LDSDSLKVNILEYSTKLGGTTADLLAGDRLSVTELMYGMMLPSGNDAAESLAIFFGNIFKMLETNQKLSPHVVDCTLKEDQLSDEELNISINECLQKFYEHMNMEAAMLGMKKSNFASAHGMYVE